MRRSETIMATKILIALLFAAVMTTVLAGSKTVKICEMDSHVGNVWCTGKEDRWSFNSEDEECVNIGTGDCGQSKNNFASKAACEETCGGYGNELDKREKTYPAACNLPSGRSGNCRAYFELYYYDADTKSCRQFVYGGCGGNANMFNTLEKCVHYCGAVDG